MPGVAQIEAFKERVRQRVDEEAPRLHELSHTIHADPELAFDEHRASGRVAEFLRGRGFEVAHGVFELPTAVVATYGEGPLTIGICAEYDALPRIGHGCGHNIIAAAGVGAAVALASISEELGVRVKLIGTPAEESGGGKILLLERGAFSDVSFAMMIHPDLGDIDPVGMSSMATTKFEVTFAGRSVHAGGWPEEGRNAGDAAALAQVAIGLLRQQLPRDCRVSSVILEGGQASNTIPDHSVISAQIRAVSIEALGEVAERVHHCFSGAAIATGCGVEIELSQPDYAELRHDPELAALIRDNLRLLGRDPQPIPGGRVGATTDMGNVSHALPAVHAQVAIRGATAFGHSQEYADVAATAAADETVVDGARAMAMTAVDMAADPERRARFIG